MKRVSTDGDRRYAAWAIRRALVALSGRTDLAVPKQAEAAIAAIESAGTGGDLFVVFREHVKILHHLKWTHPFDRELAVLVASALGIACGTADSDRGIVDALVAIARTKARVAAIAALRDTHEPVTCAEILERRSIAQARAEFQALAEVTTHG